ncbi:hypothetical protein BOX15_Mlig017367g2 [Macrostomum lignano]|uniref:VLIG-type G domain-containing protein n=1 Tax=Macrostomum lignano TaxID=282301 RepID=A0A267EPP5_9PLAT|nr:hypothetical protein BOX15_Mlig017367g2 [Macrostomum lignano]
MSGGSGTPERFNGLVSDLGLSPWFPRKLIAETAIAIRPADLDKPGLQFVRQIIGCLGKVRDELPLHQEQDCTSKIDCQQQEDGWDEDEDEGDQSGDVNPLDVLLTVFVCCSEDLKQLICHRLFYCKLAIPFIYKDETDRWVSNHSNLRPIAIEYKDKQGKAIEMPIFSDREVFCVAFVRIGEHSVSKSKILNYILSDGKHDTFFNRESKNGSARVKYSRGLIETAVYIPSGDGSDPFVALNLRGDVTENPELSGVLSKCSSTLVCMVAVEDALQNASRLQELAAEASNMVLILTKRDSNTKADSDFKNRLRKSMGDIWNRATVVLAFKAKTIKSCREIQAEVTNALRQKMGPSKIISEQLKSIGLFPMDSGDGGQSPAQLASLVTQNFRCFESKTKFKNEFLPLHMQLWQEYSKLYKETFSAKAQKENLAKMQERMLEIRNKQVELCMQFSPIIRDLFSSLNAAASQSEEMVGAIVLLEGIKQRFYECCLEVVPPLQRAFLEAKEKHDACQCETEIEALRQKLQEAEKELVNASLDLNSLFREAGQIYEASQENSTVFTPRLRDEVLNLPDTFAKLLLHGMPLEILDGDSSNIPIFWISAVLRACHKLVGEKKLFIISVLGVQSSGKSTLLNTMFGLRFPVSAGRCTRGAYLQLVKVSPEARLPFDYVAILDTEGLKAPELGISSPRHDNELATLVIGLGDVSIINIKGENSSDMKEILPIAVNAFLRMRQVNKKLEIQRSCIFIHQNVSAISAKEKMEEATAVMKKSLDDFTREAAEGEGLADVKTFNQIISFDSKMDIFFLPDLWFGDPPMASVNPGYAEKVQVIRDHIMFQMASKQKTYVSFNDFTIRIGDMWKAIMSEDFVFSFRNSIEMKAYIQMELALIDCKDQIDDFGNDWLHKTAFVQLRNASSEESLFAVKQSLQQEMSESMSSILSRTKEQLEQYFEEDSYKEHSVQWKSGSLLALDRACNLKQEELHDRIKDELKIQRLEINQAAKHKQWESTALQKAKDLAQKMTGSKISEEELKQCFDILWETIISELPTEQPHDAAPIDEQIERLLQDLFHKDVSILKAQLQQTPLSQTMSEDDFELFLSDCIEEISYTNEAAPTARSKAFTAGGKAFKSAQLLLRDTAKKDSGFYIADARKILAEVIRVLRDERSNLANDGIGLTAAFEIKVSIGICKLAIPTFEKINEAYRAKLSIAARLQTLKEKIWNLFKNMVASKAGEKISADFVRDHLAGLIKAAVLERMADKLKAHVRNQIGKHKYYLIVMMLTEWADKDNFRSIISYIENSKVAALEWLTAFIDRFLFTRNEAQRTAFSEIVEADVAASIFKTAHDSCDQACKAMAGRSGDDCMKEWSEDFCQRMSRELAVKAEDFAEIFTQPIGDFSDFSECLKEGLRVNSRQLTEWLSTLDESSVQWPGKSTLYSAVLDSLWGCDAQCPFCNEPCSNASAEHQEFSHKCIQHRPQCTAGMRRVGSNQAVPDTCGFSINDQRMRFGCVKCEKNGVHMFTYHPYKEYKKFFPSWDIAPDASNTGSKFWMWFVWTFREKLKEQYDYKIDELPGAWAAVTKDAAQQSLRELLN